MFDLVPKYRSSRIIRNIFALRFIRRGDFFKRLEKNKSATEEYYRSFLLRRLISAIRTEDELESIKSYLNIQYSKEFILFINKMALKSNKMPPGLFNPPKSVVTKMFFKISSLGV